MAMGKMRNCVMHKVKCGLKNTERWLLVTTEDVTTVAVTQFTILRSWTVQ